MTATKTAYRRHRARQIAYGRWHPWGDLQAVRAHLADLQARGHTLRGIALAAGLSQLTLYHVMNPATRHVTARVAAQVLAADPTGGPAGFVPALGAARRLKALAVLGWPVPRIADRTPGVGPAALHDIRQGLRTRVTAATHRAVEAAYRELCMTPGPSKRSVKLARAAGFAPPLAWDEDRIDDPTARPAGIRRNNATNKEDT